MQAPAPGYGNAASPKALTFRAASAVTSINSLLAAFSVGVLLYASPLVPPPSEPHACLSGDAGIETKLVEEEKEPEEQERTTSVPTSVPKEPRKPDKGHGTSNPSNRNVDVARVRDAGPKAVVDPHPEPSDVEEWDPTSRIRPALATSSTSRGDLFTKPTKQQERKMKRQERWQALKMWWQGLAKHRPKQKGEHPRGLEGYTFQTSGSGGQCAK